MTIETVLYSINIINNFDFIFGVFFTIGVIATIACFAMGGFGRIDADVEWEQSFLYKFTSFIKSHMYKIIIFIFIGCLIPSEKTMYLMLGANYLKSSELPSKVELAISKKIDEYLLETKKENKEK